MTAAIPRHTGYYRLYGATGVRLSGLVLADSPSAAVAIGRRHGRGAEFALKTGVYPPALWQSQGK